MTTPYISIISSAIHTQFWMEIYNQFNCSLNKVPFELVFVGNKTPNFQLPPNFIFIYSDAKPAKCFEIAARNAHGEYMMFFQDDLIIPDRALNWICAYIPRLPEQKKLVLTPRFSDTPNGEPRDNLLSFYPPYIGSPVIGVGTIFHRQLWYELGGIDRRFNLLFSDYDMMLRIYEQGGIPFIVPECVLKERSHEGRNRLINNYKPDRELLYSLWLLPDKTVSKKRLQSLQPYTKEEIVIVR
jgi:hypothetical protein